jgi:hypothetical protein
MKEMSKVVVIEEDGKKAAGSRPKWSRIFSVSCARLTDVIPPFHYPGPLEDAY